MIYVCSSYATYGKYMCSQHKVFEEDLFNAVKDNLKKYTRLAREEPDELVSQIVGFQKKYETDRPDKESEEYKRLQKRLADLDRAFDTLYEDHLAERISYDNFERLSEKYQHEQKEVRNRIMKYEVVDKAEEDKRTDAERVVELLAQCSDFEDLTSDMLYSLLDRIEVCEPVVVGGRVEQTLKLYYRFVGVIEPHEFNATRYYKSGQVTTLTGMRAAREREENRDIERARVNSNDL